MAADVVHLHIGSPKTGTTYLQNVMWANRKRLAKDGVLLPGDERFARVTAGRELVKWQPSRSARAPESWRRIVADIKVWKGPAAIFSIEFLSWATDEQAARIVRSLEGRDVRVVLTTRDLARLVPAQWQTAMRQRNTWTLSEYAAGVAGEQRTPQMAAAARHFWRRQDYGPILQRWGALVGTDHLTVVTVPPSGGDPDELWRRFCQAVDLDPERYETGAMTHESLGAASAEVMRRLNAAEPVVALPIRSYQTSVNGILSRKVLGPRRTREPKLSLPPQHHAWATREAARVVADIEGSGARVIGDLADLQPRTEHPDQVVPVEPDQLPAQELLAAALDGLAGMAAAYASEQRRWEKATAKLRRSRHRTRGLAHRWSLRLRRRRRARLKKQ